MHTATTITIILKIVSHVVSRDAVHRAQIPSRVRPVQRGKLGLRVTSLTGGLNWRLGAKTVLYRCSSPKPSFHQRSREQRSGDESWKILAEKGKATSHLVLLANSHDGLARVTLLQRSRNWPRRPRAKKGKALVVITSLKVSLRLHCNHPGITLFRTFLESEGIWALSFEISPPGE